MFTLRVGYLPGLCEQLLMCYDAVVSKIFVIFFFYTFDIVRKWLLNLEEEEPVVFIRIIILISIIAPWAIFFFFFYFRRSSEPIERSV